MSNSKCLVYVQAKCTYCLRSNNELILSPPAMKTPPISGDRGFVVAAPKLWNMLLNDLRNIPAIPTFKKHRKKILFSSTFASFAGFALSFIVKIMHCYYSNYYTSATVTR